MFKDGDHVRIKDDSEAHGDLGTVWHTQPNGIILVILDTEGCAWPVSGQTELEYAPAASQMAAAEDVARKGGD